MKALITGIEGFVGPYLAKELLKGKHEVYGTYLTDWKDPIKGVKVVHLDVTDKDEAASVISKIRPDWIFHLAGFSSVAQSWKSPEICFKVNVEGTRNLLDAVVSARTNQGINPKILIVSSAEVYGKPKYLPIDEKHPLNPENPYAKSRVEQEKVALEYVKKGLHIVISRSFNHTGPGQSPQFVCSDFAHQIAMIEKGLQEPVVKVGNLDVKRDFSDVRDVVRAYVLMVEKCRDGEVYNVCSGKGYIIKDILKILIGLSKTKDIIIKADSCKIRPEDTIISFGNNLKFLHETKWDSEIDFNKTLSEILDWHRKSI
ncbi:MAG: GDP-mannose 4,6-dehydratase [Candidatus Woesearchaeota archaeon]|nr:GDP-mannose 4,6-dehydratase [Candidatus Woesearchaeota archaeon]